MAAENGLGQVLLRRLPRARAEKSLRLFAQRVLPRREGHADPMNPASLEV